MEGHGTALIANIAHQVLTVRPVRRLHLTAVMIIQPLALKPGELGMALIAKCPTLPAASPLIAAQVTIRPPLAFKLGEHGTERLVRCRAQAVPAPKLKIPPRLAGFFEE